MDNQTLKKKVQRLRQQIDDLRYRYHVLNDPEVTDKMYEGLMDELRKIEEKHLEVLTSDSPTQRVAGEPLEKFEKVTHVVPQWSFNDAFNEEDLKNWEDKIHRMLFKKLGKKVKVDYTAELKIDGLHLVLTYKKGILETSATRGNGKVGENVTQNIKTIHSIPIKLKQDIDIVIEGEVWMSKKVFEHLNKEREKKGEVLFANPRNASAGTIRQLDPKIVAERKLSFIGYDISAGNIPSTQVEELQIIKKLGFPLEEIWKKAENLQDVLKFYEHWQKNKDKPEFWVDGVVVKVNKREYQDVLGYTGKAPRWAIALKFPAEQGTTKVKEIFTQVGRTGKITPVALMEPVRLAGTTVTHATLHNFDEIKRLDVRVGDTVVVQKAGDIIPQIVRVLEKMRTGKEKKVNEPTKCEICGSPVKRQKVQDKKQRESVGLFCTNKHCHGQQLERIRHFVSKKGMDIDGLGSKIVEQLLNEGLIKDVADLYTLQKSELLELEGFAEKSVDNLLESIENSKKVSLPKFLFALGIPYVGEETSVRLAENFGSFEKIREAGEEELKEVPDVGEKVAESTAYYFKNKINLDLVNELLKKGIKPQHEAKKKVTKFTGKSFVFTGGLVTLTRDEAKEIVRNVGGEVSSSVSKNTAFVVVGDEPGSKYEKAKKLGVKTLTEDEFKRLVK
jgi:DNA ligase (NAD+)